MEAPKGGGGGPEGTASQNKDLTSRPHNTRVRNKRKMVAKSSHNNETLLADRAFSVQTGACVWSRLSLMNITLKKKMSTYGDFQWHRK